MKPIFRIGNKGFSLIEVLATVSIFVFGVSRIFVVFGETGGAVRHTGNRLIAGVILENSIWKLRDSVSRGIDPGQGDKTNFLLKSHPGVELRYKVESVPGSGSLHRALVEASWSEGRKKIEISREILLRGDLQKI